MSSVNMKRFFSFSLFGLLILCNQLMGSAGKTYEEDLTITLKEKQILDQFKENVASRMPHKYMKEEVFLIRWLRAKNFDLAAAETMLFNHLKWREDNAIDKLKSEDFSKFSENKYYLDGKDREGKPVLYLNVGSWDLRRVVLAGETEKFMRYIDNALEEACGLVRELGEKYQNVSQGVLLINVDGFNLIQHGCLRCVPLVLRIIFEYEAHFPGCADKLIAINVPQIAEPLIQAARGALHPITNQALQVYGPNKNTWKAALDQYISTSELPPELGGTKLYKDMEIEDY